LAASVATAIVGTLAAFIPTAVAGTLAAAAASAVPSALAAAATAVAGTLAALAAPIAIAVPVALGACMANTLAVGMALSSLIGEGRRDEAAGDDRGEGGRSNTQGQYAQRGDDQKNMPGCGPPASGTPRGGPRSHRHPAWHSDAQPLGDTVSYPGFNRASSAEPAF
jgi:hypothetical protein